MSARRTVLALTAVALLARVATLDVQSFWSDEAATVDVLRHSFGGMLDAVWEGESTPPLFYVLAWAWAQLAGTGEVALRLPSAVLGAATVPLVAVLAARAAGGPLTGGTALRERPGRAAVLAAALAASGPLMVWYGQEARAYALLMLLATASTLALLRALEEPSRGRLAAWAALAVAAFWAHHFALFLVVGQGLWALWALRGRALAATAAVAAGALALAPVLLHQRAAGRAGFIADVPLSTRLVQLPKQVLVGYDAPAETLLTVLGLAALAVAAAGLAALLRDAATAGRRPPAAGLVVAGVAATGVGLPALAALAGQDFLLTRNLLGALPLGLALLGAGAARLPGRASGAGVAAVAVLTLTGAACAVAVDLRPAYQRDDFRAAIRAAVDGPRRARLVVTDGEGRIPAGLYLGRGTRPVPPGAVQAVREIDVVKVAGNEPGRARSTPGIREDVTPAGFVLAGTEHGDTWAVRRYVAPIPVAVDPGSLALFVPGGDVVVLQRPR